MTLIQRLDGTTYDLLDYGIRTRDVLIPSPVYEHNFSVVEGSIGLIDNGSTIKERTINCLYRATSHDIKDFSLLRDEIFNIFRSDESFYLIEKRLPGKRWLVKVSNPFQIPQRNVYGNFDIEFISIKGVSESIGTSMDIHNNGIDAEGGLWGFGMGLEAIDETLIYRHEVNAGTPFRVFNASNIPILHPFECAFKMQISNVVGSDDMFQITNLTNGSRSRVTEKVKNSDVVLYDGHFVSINNLNALRDTRRDYIYLSPGWNNFQIYYCDSATIEFDFPFYYL